ncbi:hypothetical protein [Phytoactinopolyspora halotolerans]|uniref:ATP-grasp domain-containing protein n=1 Tax=Phytoactinopolyspora halotolerans TaxID=1981512 RepID=A0A6L9S7H9_9ACTN|nr:hypothetical protein [Phytoactinopolyspora halotolerans]NEE01435.1 hypothetical protein [Phytoactinopolyspora halotolerans]
MSSTIAGLGQFLADRVPRAAGLSSAVFEHAAHQRGLPTRRLDRNLLVVELPSGHTIPFHGLNGPDTSETGRLMRSCPDALRGLLHTRGVPVAAHATFAPTQRNQAERYAERIGAPVTVSPARMAPGRGRTSGVQGDPAFRAAWRNAVDAYRRSAGGAVLVEEHVPGTRLHLFVVDERVVAGTRIGDGGDIGTALLARDHPIRAVGTDLVDITDRLDPGLGRLAVRAVAALPGLAYAGVDVLVSDAASGDEPGDQPRPEPGARGDGLVIHVDCSPEPVALFPTHGAAHDIADAVIEHYVRAPRWAKARAISHRSRQPDGRQIDGAALEPLLRHRL